MKKKIIPVLMLCALTSMPANSAGVCPIKTLCLAVFGVGEVFVQVAPAYQRPVRRVQVAAVTVLGTLITWQYIKPLMPWSECPTKEDTAEEKENS